MEEKLREVTFTLEPFKEGTFLDYEMAGEDAEKITKRRDGYFHRWGDTIVYDPELSRNLQKTVGIVEEIETGSIYEVLPAVIIFNK